MTTQERCVICGDKNPTYEIDPELDYYWDIHNKKLEESHHIYIGRDEILKNYCTRCISIVRQARQFNFRINDFYSELVGIRTNQVRDEELDGTDSVRLEILRNAELTIDEVRRTVPDAFFELANLLEEESITEKEPVSTNRITRIRSHLTPKNIGLAILLIIAAPVVLFMMGMAALQFLAMGSGVGGLALVWNAFRRKRGDSIRVTFAQLVGGIALMAIFYLMWFTPH